MKLLEETPTVSEGVEAPPSAAASGILQATQAILKLLATGGSASDSQALVTLAEVSDQGGGG